MGGLGWSLGKGGMDGKFFLWRFFSLGCNKRLRVEELGPVGSVRGSVRVLAG